MTNYIIDENYLDVMVENSLLDLYKDMPVTYVNYRVSVVHVLIKEFQECLLGTYPYYSLPTCFAIESKQDLEAAGVNRVQQNPNLALYGKDVVVGIVDTGIQYTHPAFLNADGTTRIAAIWDQTIEDPARQPASYGFGAVYTKDDINQALGQANPLETVPTTDENGHGTMIAGVAAGSVVEQEQFQGVASQCELVIVKCKPAKKYNRRIFMIREDALCFQETDIMLGMRYLNEYAISQNKSISICLALGSSEGGHVGDSAISKFADFITQIPRQCVTISAGNEGNNKRHLYGTYTSLDEFVDFELNVDQKDPQFTMELWQNAPNRSAIEVITPTAERTEIVYPRVNECHEFSFVFEASKVWVNNIIVEEETGQQAIILRFADASPGVWTFRVYNMDHSNAFFNVWLPSATIISTDTFFLRPNPETTITVPANAVFPITVTAFNSRDNSIWTEASRGYTASGIIKPDIAAPGVNIQCPTLNGGFGTGTGTGVAAAMTAGIAAMILEWAIVRKQYPPINGTNVKQFIIRGAIREVGISGGDIYPNKIWGYGKINVYEVFNRIR